MDDLSGFGCFCLLMLAISGAAGVFWLIDYEGYNNGRQETYSRIQYVRTNHGQTTATLDRGLRIILDGNDPETMDKTVATYKEVE